MQPNLINPNAPLRDIPCRRQTIFVPDEQHVFDLHGCSQGFLFSVSVSVSHKWSDLGSREILTDCCQTGKLYLLHRDSRQYLHGMILVKICLNALRIVRLSEIEPCLSCFHGLSKLGIGLSSDGNA
jgi:hypothetical protein